MPTTDGPRGIKDLCAEYATGRITYDQFERGVDRLVEERAEIESRRVGPTTS